MSISTEIGTDTSTFEHPPTEAELEQFLQDGLISQKEVDARYLATLTRQQARQLLNAMRQAIAEVPSYVETQALQQWIENGTAYN